MTQSAKTITHDDILDLEEFEAVRKQRRDDILPLKRLRRVALGPDAMLYFESYATMWLQIHEMLRIEKGGDEQIEDELSAYNPLIPNGQELVATLMFEINDEDRRNRVLRTLTDVELKTYLQVGESKSYAVPEQDVERTTADGKTSSVHFLHFPLTTELRDQFKKGDVEIKTGCDHENYGHIAVINKATRTELAKDLD